MPVDPPTLLLIALAVLVAGLAQGAIGFGFGLVSMSLLPLILGVKGAVPVVSLLAGTTNLLLFLRFRGSFSVRDAAPLLRGVLVGIPLGVALMRASPADGLMLLLGVTVLSYVAQTLLRSGVTRQLGPRIGTVLGFFSGLLGGALNTGGPPSVAWVTSQPWGNDQLRATLLSGFMLTSLVQITLFVSSGVLGRDAALTALWALPAAWLGSWLGAKLGDRIPAESFRKAMLVGLGVIGVTYTLRGASGLLG